MATIQTSITMADNISATLNNITNALNMTLTAFEGIQNTASNDIDVNAFEGIRAEINAATIATQQFESELSKIQPKSVPVEVTPVWNIESKLDIFQNTGIDRLNLEMGSLNDITNEILKSQQRIGEQALNMDLLPPNASWDINATNQRIQELGQKLSDLQNVDISTMDDASIARMNSEYEVMRSSMNNVINLQEDMNAAIEQGDFSRLNAGYNQLNDIAEQVERRVRDNTAAIEEMNRIEWNTPQNIEMFQGNDVQRYKQEVQSTNDMLSRLTFAQAQISNNAAAMRILPPQALNDIQGMGSRIQSLRAQIEQVQKTRIQVVGVERANAEVEQLRAQLNNAVQVQEQMNTAIGNMDVSGANAAYNQLNSIVSATERHIRDNTNEQQNFNNEIRNGENSANGLKGVLAAMAGVFSVKAAVDWVKESVAMTNESIQAEQQLANVLANQGSSYQDLITLKQKADAIQGTTMYEGDAMIGGAGELATYIKDVDALQSMMGTLSNYAAGMSGGAEVSYQQMVDYATQLGKALDGTYDGLKKKGFELSDAQKEIIENGSDMQKALVIDEVINQSWAGLAEQMAQTPQGMMVSMTNGFNDIRENVGAQLLPVIMNVFTMIQEHMPQIEQMLYGLVPVIETIIQTIGNIINAAFAVYDFFVNNWSWIEPIIWGIVAAFIMWKIVTIAQTIQQWLLNAAILAQTIQQWLLNAAILANPITWIIIAIAAVIAAIVLWANSVGGFRVLWLIVVNAILTAWDWVKIGFFTGVYWVIDLWDKMKLGMMTAGTAIANFMGDMKANVLMILQNMVNGAINIINGFIGILNKIPGVNIGLIEQVTFGTTAQLENEAAKQAREDALSEYRNEIDAGIAERAGKLDAMKNDAQAATADRLAGIDAARAEAQKKQDDKAVTTPSDFVNTSNLGGDGMGNIANDTANIAGNTAAMKNTGEEDVKYLRDIAERETINRYFNIEFGEGSIQTQNTVNSEMDLDGVAEKIYDAFGGLMMERIDVSAEGVLV